MKSITRVLKEFWNYLIISAVVVLFIVILVGINLNANKLFPGKEDLADIPINVLIALLTALLGGIFALISVEKSADKQNITNFIKEFPFKIMQLDHLISNLNTLSSVIKPDRIVSLQLESNKLESLLDTTINIDGYIYFKVRMTNIRYKEIFYLLYDNPEVKLIERDAWGVWHEVEGKRAEILEHLAELEELINSLLIELRSYRKSFIDYYNQNIDKRIYKKIDSN
ncbi:hypothetical protein [Bacillus sp. 1P06AnD]|uniref:hypothetical protein n=1 Tax=Bacillus sp. 1P06AnD TaxID=3132208 RepID=UPI00399EF0E3